MSAIAKQAEKGKENKVEAKKVTIDQAATYCVVIHYEDGPYQNSRTFASFGIYHKVPGKLLAAYQDQLTGAVNESTYISMQDANVKAAFEPYLSKSNLGPHADANPGDLFFSGCAYW
jgi:hypothetical protein